MVMTVISVKNVPVSLRGDLTRWMQEISTGVYVGNFNARIRDLLWKRVTETTGEGEAVLCYASRNELGYSFKTYNSARKVIDYDGIPLVFIPNDITNVYRENLTSGFSTASHMHMSRKNASKSRKPNDFIVLDLETTGLDPYKCEILEIGAVKQYSGKTSYFHQLINSKNNIPEKIVKLTGITNELILKKGIDCKQALKSFIDFAGELPIITYNAAFDINFLNESLIRQGMEQLNNKIYDLMKIVKREQLFQTDYKLETSLKTYGITSNVPHRALEDAKLAYKLMMKVNKF